MRELARRLVAYEAAGKKRTVLVSAADAAALEKLRPQLITLMGHLGYQALLQRAGVMMAAESRSPRRNTVLLAGVLTLLEAFIGENLTLQLVKERWPTVPLTPLDSGTGEPHENET
jgi:hypothetical protein